MTTDIYNKALTFLPRQPDPHSHMMPGLILWPNTAQNITSIFFSDKLLPKK